MVTVKKFSQRDKDSLAIVFCIPEAVFVAAKSRGKPWLGSNSLALAYCWCSFCKLNEDAVGIASRVCVLAQCKCAFLKNER